MKADMTREELLALADALFADVVEQLKELTPNMNDVERAGSIAGILIASGVALAAAHGAPRDVVELALREKIQDAYGKK